MTTWGNVDDFRHFLPRILELFASDSEIAWFAPEVILAKLRYGNWSEWPQSERESVQHYLNALWEDAIVRHPYHFEISEIVCSFAQVIDDLTPFLKRWPVAENLSSAVHFAEFVDVTSIHRRPVAAGLLNAFWEDRAGQRLQVEQWMLLAERQAELEAAYFRFGQHDDEIGQQLSTAISHLDWLKTSAA